jgi:hypothetical protein
MFFRLIKTIERDFESEEATLASARSELFSLAQSVEMQRAVLQELASVRVDDETRFLIWIRQRASITSTFAPAQKHSQQLMNGNH